MVGYKTLALIKPDGYAKKAEIINKIMASERFSIVVQKKMRWNEEMAANFYEEHRSRHFFLDLIAHMSSGPLIALVLKGDEETVGRWRELMGATDPSKAAPGTIRNMFATSGDPVYKNVVHGSDSPEAAKREIKLVFAPFELLGK